MHISKLKKIVPIIHHNLSLTVGLLLLASVFSSHAQWTAYLDWGRGTGTATSNVLSDVFSLRLCSVSGYLTNQSTGEPLPAFLVCTNNSSASPLLGATLSADTPAFDVFNGFCDLSKYCWAPGAGGACSIQISNLNPAARYRVVGTLNSTYKYITKVELIGSINCIPSHSTNVITNGLAFTQAALSNYNASGDYIAWSEIDPGADGTIVIASSRFTNQSALALGALRIEEYSAPVVIKTQPQDLIACPASPAVFSVRAWGSPPLSYQWFESLAGVTNTLADETNATFVLSSANENAGYFVVVSNNYGVATSSVAQLVICRTPIEITAQPQDADSMTHSNVIYFADVSPMSHLVSLQWYYSPVSNIVDAVRIENATNSMLMLTNLALSQKGYYFARLSNCVGTVTTRLAALTFFNEDLGIALNCPYLSWTNGTVGNSASYFYSTTNGFFQFSLDTNDANVKWVIQRTNTQDGVSAIQSSAKRSGGQASKIATSLSGPGKLTFWWKTRASDPAAGLLFVMNGSSYKYSLFMNATNWKEETFFLPAGAYSLAWIFCVNNSSTQPVAWLDHVSYLSNAPPAILAQPGDVAVLAGSNAFFQVQAEGCPPLSYQWQFNGQDIPKATMPQFTIREAKPSEAGGYSVVVMSASGTITSRIATLTVADCPPLFHRQRSYVTTIPGGDAVLKAGVFATPPVSYQWYFEGAALPEQTNASLRLHNVAVNQVGHYTVAATNALGGAVSPERQLLLSGISNVIHISVDGFAAKYLADELQSEPHRYPNFSKLCDEGTYTLNARCDYDISVTVPNHLSILTGRPILQPAGQPDTVQHGYDRDDSRPGISIHIFGNPNVPYKASVFDVAHDRGRRTAFMVGKSSLTICNDSYNSTNGGPDLILPDNGRSKIDSTFITDAYSPVIVDAFLPSLTNGAPFNYAFLHFGDLDFIGHSQYWGSDAWFDGLQQVDTQLGRILAAIETNPDPAISLGTALVVTADHGGFDRSHSDATLEYDYTIPIFVWGPGFFLSGTDLYSLFPNRVDPGTNRVDYNSMSQPLRNGDTGNLALSMLGLPPIPGSTMVVSLPNSPALVSIRKGAQPAIEWSTAAAQWTLEISPSLGPDANWTAVTTGIITNSLTFSYPLPDASNPMFFRLKKTP